MAKLSGLCHEKKICSLRKLRSFTPTGVSFAGPCNTTANKDAGSGPTPGAAAQSTTGTATPASRSGDHPPTSAMNTASENVAASSQDAQRQMQGQPTAAQEAKGSKAKSGNDC
jgi:hypothetical protein